MPKQKIQYFASSKILPNYVAQRLEDTDFELEKYELGAAITSDIFFLFSPIFHADCFLVTDALWKKYFSEHHPNVRLVTVGKAKEQHPNSIDLLAFPDSLETFVVKAALAKEKWKPVHIWGLDMAEKLERLVEGHGSNGIMQLYSSIEMNVKVLSDRANNQDSFANLKIDLIDKSICEDWAILKNRFSHYYPFFSCLPLFHLFKQVDYLITKIEPLFQGGLEYAIFKEEEYIDKIEGLRKLLSQIEQYAKL